MKIPILLLTLTVAGFAAEPPVPQFRAVTLDDKIQIGYGIVVADVDGHGHVEIEARDASALEEATDLATEAIRRRFGNGPVDGKIQAHVVAIESVMSDE